MHKFSNLLENKVQVLCSVLKLRVLWFIWKVKMLVTQLCLTLCKPMDCSLSGSSIHGILQARILDWVAISFSRVSSQPRNRTQFSCTAGRFFTNWAMREHVISFSYKSKIFYFFPFCIIRVTSDYTIDNSNQIGNVSFSYWLFNLSLYQTPKLRIWTSKNMVLLWLHV